MKVTNRTLAFLGVGIGAVGLWLEWDKLFPSGLKNPLTTRPIGTTPATGRPAVRATQATTGRVSPTGTTTQGAGAGAPRGATSQGPTLSLGTVLTPLASFLGNFLRPDGQQGPKPSSSGGGGGMSFGGAPSSPGGSAGRVDAGRGAPFAMDNTSTAGGAGPQGGGAPYADEYGQVAYPASSGAGYQDEWGNQVYIDNEGHVTYDYTQDVGYVAGGEVFPGSYDANDPSTFDFYGDGGPLAAPDPASSSIDSDFYPDGGPLADPGFLATDGIPDLGVVDPGMFADDGSSDYGGDFGGWGGGGDGSFYSDNETYDGF